MHLEFDWFMSYHIFIIAHKLFAVMKSHTENTPSKFRYLMAGPSAPQFL